VSLTTPPGVASPNGWVAASSWPHVTPGQVDDEAVVDVRQAGDVVAAPANCDRQVALARETDRRRDVDCRARSHDQGRAGIDHAVPDAPGLVVFGIGRLGDGAGDERAQRSGRIACGRCQGHGAGLPLMVNWDEGQLETAARPTIELQASKAGAWTNANHKCDKRGQSAPHDAHRLPRFRNR